MDFSISKFRIFQTHFEIEGWFLVSVKKQNELLHVYEYFLFFQIKYSLMKPGVHVWPHCGPTNCRIRAHLGLVIPDGPKIRVADETRYWLIPYQLNIPYSMQQLDQVQILILFFTDFVFYILYRTWKEGEFVIIDDSFEHEVWHNGKSERLILIVDFWHPDIDEKTRRTLDPI